MPRTGPVCGYCGSASILVDGSHVYGPTFEGRFNLWACSRYPECDAYVGVHANSPDAAPKGSLANPALRKLRIQVHRVFDDIWQSKAMSRNAAYRKLEGLMGHAKGHCHIGAFSEDECRKALMALVPAGEELFSKET